MSRKKEKRKEGKMEGKKKARNKEILFTFHRFEGKSEVLNGSQTKKEETGRDRKLMQCKP